MDTDSQCDRTVSSLQQTEFGEWLTRVVVRRLLRQRGADLWERRARAATLRLDMEVDDVVVATADYVAVADDEVSLKAGDIVEVLDTKSPTSSKYRGRVYCYDSHFFQPRGYSIEYIFSAPTYRMYYV